MLQTWTCTTCGKGFTVGEWLCASGQNHTVEEKTFLSLDPPSAPGQYVGQPPIIRGKTTVCNIPPPKKVMEGGEVKMVGEGSVEFINGKYTTGDPEKIFWLEKKPAYNATIEQWKAVWWTREEINSEKELELKAKEQRLENERNELLAQVKQKHREAVSVR